MVPGLTDQQISLNLLGWRNLHWTGPAVIAAKLAVEGRRQPLAVRREWPPDSDPAAGADSAGGVRGDGAHAALGWDEAITGRRGPTATGLGPLGQNPA